MSELPWLDRYSGETVDELLALEGKYRVDSLLRAFERAIEKKAARVGTEKLTDEELAILAIEALEREVNNGGYAQFFVNPSRQYAPVIVDSLRGIGCAETAEITEDALGVVERFPITQKEIEECAWTDHDDRSEELMECDELYFGRPEDIEEHLFAFIKANRSKIRF